MKLLLLKCAICDYWHNPSAHSNHCPHCGSLRLRISPRVVKHYYLDDSMLRAIEVVRSIPRPFEQSINCK